MSNLSQIEHNKFLYYFYLGYLETAPMRHTGEILDRVGPARKLSEVWHAVKTSPKRYAGFIMRAWDYIYNCPSYTFICETNDLYEDVAL